jgi:uncharacterized membrane protein (UPF0127 family)
MPFDDTLTAVILRRSLLRLVALGALAASAGALPACKAAGERKPTAGSGPSAAPLAPAPTASVNVDTGAHWVSFRVELARTPPEHERGLMFRTHLDEDAGMLFLFERPSRQTFWMKNTLIPLDMVFISADLRIVGIVVDAEPQTLTPRAVDEPSQFVLELAGGVATKLGLRAGQRVELKGL